MRSIAGLKFVDHAFIQRTPSRQELLTTVRRLAALSGVPLHRHDLGGMKQALDEAAQSHREVLVSAQTITLLKQQGVRFEYIDEQVAHLPAVVAARIMMALGRGGRSASGRTALLQPADRHGMEGTAWR